MKKFHYIILVILTLALSLSMTSYKIQSNNQVVQQQETTFEQEMASIKKDLTR
jgi:hypothetical protein